MARATTEDDIQVEARDGPPEQPVEMKSNNKKSIGLRFRRRKEHAEPRGPAAIGRRPFPPTTTPTHPSPTLEPPPQPLPSHALCVDTPHCWRPWEGPVLSLLVVKWVMAAPWGALRVVRS